MRFPIKFLFKPAAPSGKRHDRGFTLLEIMVSSVVFTLGVLALAVMQVSSISGNASSASVTDATFLGISQIEQLMDSDYDAVLTAGTTTTTVTTATYPASTYTITQTITDNDVINDTKTAIITVQWTYNGNQKQVTIQQVIPRII